MNKFFILGLILLANGLDEPEAINDKERNDEVAQAQDRSVLITCMFIAYKKLEDSSDTLKNIKSTSVFSLEEIRKKIALDIIEKCTGRISWRQAEKIMATDNFNIDSEEFKDIADINIQQFQSSFNFSQVQLDILAKIEKEINIKDEDIVPMPQQRNGSEIYQESFYEASTNYYYIVIFAVFVLIIIAFLFSNNKKGRIPSQSATKKIDNKKKKN